MALGHLAPDRIGMLLAPLDLGFDAVRFEVRLDAPPDPLDEVAAALVKLLEPLGDRFIGVGLELAEGEGLHLGHELVHADPLGKRGVDVHRLAGDAAALFLILDEMEGPHIVRSEEHTSELQSLMRISYAVFCLKKK